MIYLNLFIFLLLTNAYILDFSLCTSTDNKNDENNLPRHPIDLELRLGQPGLIVDVNAAQSPNHELNQMQSKSKKGQKRKRKESKNDKEELQAQKERKKEYTRLSARKRRQKIKEKGPEAVEAERAIQKEHQKNYIARISGNPFSLERYHARKRKNELERYRRVTTNEMTAEQYRTRLKEARKKRRKLQKENHKP